MDHTCCPEVPPPAVESWIKGHPPADSRVWAWRFSTPEKGIQVLMGRGRFTSCLTSGSAGATAAHCLLPPGFLSHAHGSPYTPVFPHHARLWLGCISPLTGEPGLESRCKNKNKTKLQPSTSLSCFLISSCTRNSEMVIWTTCRRETCFQK